MNIKGLIKRLNPLRLKLTWQLSNCPWSSVLWNLDPRTLCPKTPLINIDVIAIEGDLKKLRFGNKHDIWFPVGTTINQELWNEYLSVFWESPANSHYYFKKSIHIKPGDFCIDCGTCEGAFVLLALEYGAEKVICIEPNEVMLRCLKKTFESEIEKGKVIICSAAVGPYCGETSFSSDDAYPSFGRINDINKNRIKIPVKTIDSICEEMNISRVDFIKMDIEGAEIQAIEGSLDTLRKHHPKLAITTYHRPFDFRCLEAILSSEMMKTEATGITNFGGGAYRPVMIHAS